MLRCERVVHFCGRVDSYFRGFSFVQVDTYICANKLFKSLSNFSCNCKGLVPNILTSNPRPWSFKAMDNTQALLRLFFWAPGYLRPLPTPQNPMIMWDIYSLRQAHILSKGRNPKGPTLTFTV